MLVTLVKDSGSSSFLGMDDAAAIRLEEDLLARAGLATSGFSVELPYTPQGATVLAPVLLAWRKARAGRTVTLTFQDGSAIEIGELSAAEIEWKLPLVDAVAIVEAAQA
jgi:hypothetical protein